MEPSSNITSHNARIGHIRKFVMVPPERGHTLALVSIEDPPCRLGEWTRVECAENGSRAIDIDGLVDEHTRALTADCSFTLAWIDEQKQLVTSKRLNVRYRSETDDETTQKFEALGIVGTQQGALMQHQRLYEALTKTYLSAHQTQVAMANERENRAWQAQERQAMLFEKILGTLGNQLIETHKLNHAAHIEQDKQRIVFRREIEDITDRAMSDAGGDSGLLEKALPLLQQAIPALVQGFMGAMQAKAAAAAPPPAGPAPDPKG